MRKRLLFAVMGLVLAGVASAQEAAPVMPRGYQTHDGLYLSLGLGVGSLASSSSSSGIDLEISGTGPVLNLAFGGALNPNVLIGGRIFSAAASDPSVKVNGTNLGSADGTNGLVGYGFDLVYYFNPANIYLGVSPALTRLNFTDSAGDTGSTDLGFGLRLAAGKEWWVSDNWGIGLNLEYIRSSNKDAGDTVGTNWFGVALSATFN